ncbi:MAG: CHASE2 domain-containing protein, partial [Waterburya sp.]
MPKNQDSKWLRIIIYIVIIALFVYLPKNWGWTQPWELFFYDFLTRLQPTEPSDERIIIVGLTEEDIEKLSAIPVPDQTLAQLINRIRKNHPRVIGMDLHRNVPTGKGHSKLQSVLKSTEQIVGVEKTSQGSFDFPAVAPNPILEKKGMSSASDVIVDSGDVIRRGYLYVSKSSNSSEQIPSFGLKVALEYLEKEGIYPQSSGNQENDLKLNNTIFPKLKSNQGWFYSSNDLDNRQILIKYRAAKFKTLS